MALTAWDVIDRGQRGKYLERARECLSERERLVLRLRAQGKTYSEIGLQIGTSKERVPQILRVLKRKLDKRASWLAVQDWLLNNRKANV